MMTVQEIRNKLAVLSDQPVIRRVILFGSYARGDASRRSDLDLVVIMNTNNRFFDRYDQCTSLYDLLGNSLDILPYTEDEFSSISHRRFIQSIIKEGIVVYESKES